MTRLRPLILATAMCAALIGAGIACTQTHSLGRRVIVLGFDGLDFTVTRDLMARGRLPAFTRLAQMGTFAPLRTTIPPQSPVAWSSFITGLDPGGHGIFDFIHRDPRTMKPYLSTSRTEPPRHFITLGRWQLPLTGGRVELLRRGTAFWDLIEERGINTTIIRMPANFPPSGTASRELSGMGTPDLLGTYGTFSYYTSDPFVRAGSVSGGTIHFVEIRSGQVRARLEGPDHPLRKVPTKLTADLVVHLDTSRTFAKVVVGDETRLLRVGEWSDWVPVVFSYGLGELRAQVRFYLKQLDPEFALYVSPLNLDPFDPALPLSSPDSFASELARATGRFYTQGMPEDTQALKAGVLTIEEFLEQARLAGEEVERQYDAVLEQFTDGFLFYYFGNVDQVSHMLWHATDPEHPAYDPSEDSQRAEVIAALYASMDRIVERTLGRLRPDDLLVVMSDHGFVSWRRSFNLNAWLRDRGYLHLRPGAAAPGGASFDDIDWSRTRAYGLGLNGLYINVRGRESAGIVDPGERDALVREIGDALLATIDPATGAPVATKVFRREDVYAEAQAEVAPDLVIGYAKGTRASDESALGGVSVDVLTDNTGKWTGDHCMDPDAVPGILLTSRPLTRSAATLQELAPALLAEVGIAGFPTERKE